MDGADGLDFVLGSEELLFDLESLELPDERALTSTSKSPCLRVVRLMGDVQSRLV